MTQRGLALLTLGLALLAYAVGEAADNWLLLALAVLLGFCSGFLFTFRRWPR